MRTKGLPLAAVLSLGLMGLAACGGYNREDTINDFVEQGLTNEQATCMVDTLEEKIGADRLGERGVSEEDLTEEELQIITEATTTCVLGG